QLEEEREQEMHLRFTLRKDEWDALKRARDAEQSQREKTRAKVARIPFFEQVRMWREERKREAEILRATAAEIGELRRKECQAEEKRGPEDPLGKSKEKK